MSKTELLNVWVRLYRVLKTHDVLDAKTEALMKKALRSLVAEAAKETT